MPLVISEKNNAAKRIAAILSDNDFEKKMHNKVPVYTFDNGGGEFKIIGLRGHVFNLDYPREYNNWSAVDPKELIWVDPTSVVQDKNIVGALERLATEFENVIIATDYDREGELIGVEGLNVVEENHPTVQSYRARFSALTPTEVTNAFESLGEIDFNLSAAAAARQKIDLAWGASLTRFISLASNQVGRDFLSVGRVQTPTLALIVERDKVIKAFVPEPYWVISALLYKEIEFPAKHKTRRFKKKEKAEAAFKRAKEAKEAAITKVERREKKEKPPTPFSTTTFIKAANRIGFTPARAMRVAENLYTEGWISYPRTDNTHYPESLDLRKILEEFATSDKSDAELAAWAKELLEQEKLTPTHGKKKATDHPPIHPTAVAAEDELRPDRWRIYKLVVSRFYATLAPAAKVEHIKLEFDLNGEPFRSRGYRVLEPGWKKYYPYKRKKERPLPKVTRSDMIPVKNVDLTEKETQPPRRYSQGKLISEMEKRELGTKSTRHGIIQKLYLRGYIESSSPEPTLSGTVVTEMLKKHAETITKAEMTAELEKEMNQIAEGELEDEAVVKRSQEMLEKVFEALQKHREKIGEEVKAALHEQNVVGKCSRCGRDMVAARSRWGKRYARCTRYPRCRNSYPLPQKGKIVATGEWCEKCRAPLIELIAKRGKKWEICINIDCPEKKDYFKQHLKYKDKKKKGKGKAKGKDKDKGKGEGTAKDEKGKDAKKDTDGENSEDDDNDAA